MRSYHHHTDPRVYSRVAYTSYIIVCNTTRVTRITGRLIYIIPALGMRPYLTAIKVQKHRDAFVCPVTSSHSLAIERLRYAERYRPYIPTEWRLCRFCQQGTEDEGHALLSCNGNSALALIRHTFLDKAC